MAWRITRKRPSHRRDPETAASLERIWRDIRHLPNLVHSFDEKVDSEVRVLADGLIENGASGIGKALMLFANRMKRWREAARKEKGYVDWSFKGPPALPQWSDWKKLVERVDDALVQIYRRHPNRREWHHKHRTAFIVRRGRDGYYTVQGPLPITPEDTEDIDTVRKWLRKHGEAVGKLRKSWKDRGAGQSYGYVELHRKPDLLTIYPEKGFDSISIELGKTRVSNAAREIREIDNILRKSGYTNTFQAARKMWKRGHYTPASLKKDINSMSEETRAYYRLRRRERDPGRLARKRSRFTKRARRSR